MNAPCDSTNTFVYNFAIFVWTAIACTHTRALHVNNYCSLRSDVLTRDRISYLKYTVFHWIANSSFSAHTQLCTRQKIMKPDQPDARLLYCSWLIGLQQFFAVDFLAKFKSSARADMLVGPTMKLLSMTDQWSQWSMVTIVIVFMIHTDAVQSQAFCLFTMCPFRLAASAEDPVLRKHIDFKMDRACVRIKKNKNAI